MSEPILYFYDPSVADEHAAERDRVHNRPECLVLANLNGVAVQKWEPISHYAYVRDRGNQIKPCCGCGEPIYQGVTHALD